MTQVGQIIEAKDQLKMFMRDDSGNLNHITPKGWEHFK